MIKKIIFNPPFGTYITAPWATQVFGTYTYEKRSGLLFQIIKTFRPYDSGWINKIGFRNKGWKNIKTLRSDVIYSVAGLDGNTDWVKIFNRIPVNMKIHMELNASCPNVGGYDLPIHVMMLYAKFIPWVSIKLPPTDRNLSLASKAYKSGIRIFHCCNTIPLDRGGVSGPLLKPYSLDLIRSLKSTYSDITIIGGGGIYTPQDIDDYIEAGADHLALGTVFLNPTKLAKVINHLSNINWINI